MSWFETNHCKTKKHCKVCRDLDGGRSWRIDVRNTFAESNEPYISDDFECPYGKKWIDFTIVKKVKKNKCGGCKDKAEKFKKALAKEKIKESKGVL